MHQDVRPATPPKDWFWRRGRWYEWPSAEELVTQRDAITRRAQEGEAEQAKAHEPIRRATFDHDA